MTQLVQHSSRPIEYNINFSANGDTSWTCIAEGTIEIYAIESNNVDSFTVNGNDTLPVTIGAGVGFPVSITKTNDSETASIKLLARRPFKKTFNFNAPNYNAYDGRYIYVLLNDNTVLKLDSNLLLPSNYSGDGAWIVSPVVATINLPALPNGATYTAIQFVKNGGIEKIFLIGGEANSFKWYASFIRISDDTIWNMDFSVQDSYTQVMNSTLLYNSPGVILYDFLNEYLYIRSTQGSNGGTVLRVELDNLVYSNMGYSSFIYRNLGYQKPNPFQFSPYENQFINIGDLDFTTSRSHNYKIQQNNGNVFGYRFDINRRLSTGISFGQLNYFNEYGQHLSVVNWGGVGQYSCTDLKGFYRAQAAWMTYKNYFSITNWGTLSTQAGQTTHTTNYMSSLLNCNINSLFIGFECSSSFVFTNRMILFKEDQAPADFAYYDFATNMLGACSTQLLI
nr:hypothetical protein [uncultured Carboxylicivirga sp.]